MRDPRTARRSVPTQMLFRLQAKPALECGSPLPLCRSADSLATEALANVGLVRAVSVSTLLGDGRAAGLSRLPMPYRTWDFDRVFHLVSACFTWFQLREKIRRGVYEARNLELATGQPFVKHQIPTSKRQRTFKCQSPNDLLANVRIGLGAWELVLPWSLDVGAWSFVAFHAIWAHFCSISVPNGRRCFTLFHLVALTPR